MMLLKFISKEPVVSLDKQRGSFMLFTLIIIALLTSVSVVGMQNTIQSSRLTQSYKSYALAEQRAQVALFNAYSRLNKIQMPLINSNNKPLVPGFYPQLLSVENKTVSAWRFVNSNDLWQDDSYVVVEKASESSSYLSSYMIEKIELVVSKRPLQIYRITAKGYGLSTKTGIVLQVLVDLNKTKRQLSWSIVH